MDIAPFGYMSAVVLGVSVTGVIICRLDLVRGGLLCSWFDLELS